MQVAKLPPSSDQQVAIERELVTFTKYLTMQQPNAYLARQYSSALAARGLATDVFSWFDRMTVGIARINPLCARMADSYCAVFHRRGVLRRKLILHMAILEHTGPYSDVVERSPARTKLGAIGVLALAGAQFAISLAGGAVLLVPAHILFVLQSYRNTSRAL